MVSRRWVLFALTVVLLTYGAYLLGQWQFHRLDDREASNAGSAPTWARRRSPVDDVLAAGPAGRRARRVAAGRRPPAPTPPTSPWSSATRPATAPPGVDVVTPLRTADGPACSWTGAGWRPATRGADTVDAPRAAGRRGHGRRAGCAPTPPATAGQVTDRSARAISSAEIGADARTGRCTAASSTCEKESPRAERAAGARRAARPRQRAALLLRPAVVVLRGAGRVRLLLPRLRRAQEAARGGRAPGALRGERSMPPSTGSITPVTKLAAGDSRNAAARPNSSGRRSGAAGSPPIAAPRRGRASPVCSSSQPPGRSRRGRAAGR